MMNLLVSVSVGVGIGIAALAFTTAIGYVALRLVVQGMARHLTRPNQ